MKLSWVYLFCLSCLYPPQPNGEGYFCLLEVLLLKLAQPLSLVNLQLLSLLQDDWTVYGVDFCFTVGWTPPHVLPYIRRVGPPTWMEEGHMTPSPQIHVTRTLPQKEGAVSQVASSLSFLYSFLSQFFPRLTHISLYSGTWAFLPSSLGPLRASPVPFSLWFYTITLFLRQRISSATFLIGVNKSQISIIPSRSLPS